MWLHRVRDQPPTAEEVEGKGRRVKPLYFPNTSGERSQYYPPGHFFNPYHRNPLNPQKIQSAKTVDLKNEITFEEEKKRTPEPI